MFNAKPFRRYSIKEPTIFSGRQKYFRIMVLQLLLLVLPACTVVKFHYFHPILIGDQRHDLELCATMNEFTAPLGAADLHIALQPWSRKTGPFNLYFAVSLASNSRLKFSDEPFTITYLPTKEEVIVTPTKIVERIRSEKGWELKDIVVHDFHDEIFTEKTSREKLRTIYWIERAAFENIALPSSVEAISVSLPKLRINGVDTVIPDIEFELKEKIRLCLFGA